MASALGKPAYSAPLVLPSGVVSPTWLRWFNELFAAGQALTTAQTSLASLQATLATDTASIKTLQTALAAAQSAITTSGAALAAALTPIQNTLNQQTQLINTLAAQVAALQQYPNVQGVVIVTAAYTFGRSDYLVEANAAGGAFAVTLPALSACVTGEMHNLQKSDSSVNVVTLAGNGQTINGAASIAIALSGLSLAVIFDGANWRVF